MKLQYLALLFFGLFMSLQANATLVNTTFSGTVTVDNSGSNPFGLSNGDAIFGSATYDDALVVATDPDQSININGLSGWDFEITLGTFTFSQSSVTDPGYTKFWFSNGSFDGVEFYIEPIDIGAFSNMVIEDFNGGRSLFVEDAANANPIYLEANWDLVNASTPTPVNPSGSVPLPSTLALFLIGFFAFASFASAKRKTTV